MPLNPLSLDVTYGVAGRAFQATVLGLSSGSTLEVLNDGTPGFSTVNGRVYMSRLPGAYPVATVILRETKAGEAPRDSRIDIAVDGIALGAAGLSNAVLPAVASAAIVPTGQLAFASQAEAAARTVGPDIQFLQVGFANAGTARFRKAVVGTVPYEGSLAGAFTTADGQAWIFADQRIRPEWMNMGALPNATGDTGVGVDCAPAIRAMQATAEALGIQWHIPPGKWRAASAVPSPEGQLSLMLLGSNSYGVIEGDFIHDLYTNNAGSPVAIYTKGRASAPISNVKLFFNGGRVVFPNDAVQPGASIKGGIKLTYINGLTVVNAATTGSTRTGFQLGITGCTNVVVNGGQIGVNDAPLGAGDDGLHLAAGCKNVTAFGLVLRSGDDSISLTMEGGISGQIMEDINIFGCVGDTQDAKFIKIHCISPTQVPGGGATNCTIRKVKISSCTGRVRGSVTGGGVSIQNDAVADGCLIDDITLYGCETDIGVPKLGANIAASMGSGDNISVINANRVRFFNHIARGSANSMVTFRNVTNSGMYGCELYTGSNTLAVLIPSVTITQTEAGSGGLTRVRFSGSPDLSAIETALTTFTNLPTGQTDNKLPLLRVTAGMNAYNTGDFLIRQVDNTAKFVEIENLRPGGSGQVESGVTGTASVAQTKTPDITIFDCQNIKIRDTRLFNQMGWAGCFVGSRAGTANANIQVDLQIDGFTYGNGIFVTRGTRGTYKLVGDNGRSGSVGVRIFTSGDITQAFNDVGEITDNSAIASSTQGWARTAITDYSSDRINRIRGNTSSWIRGTATIPTTASSVTVAVGVGNFAGHSVLTAMDASWITITPPPGAAGWGVAYSNGVFTISVPSNPAAALAFAYKIRPPL